MSVSVIGICGLEYYWVATAIEAEQEEFDRSAQRALHTAIDELEKVEAESLLTQKLGKPVSGINVSYDFEKSENGETFVISEFRINDSVPMKWSREIEVFEASEQLKNRGEPEIAEIREFEGNVVRKEVIRASNDDEQEEIMIFVTDSGDSIQTTSTAKSFKRKLNVYTDALEEVIVRDLGKSRSLEDRVGSVNLDSLIAEKLKAEGIRSDFNWAITNAAEEAKKTMVNSGFSEASVFDFQAPVFPDMPEEVILSIGFPSKKLYVFKRLGGMLALVVVFSLFMIVTFATTLHLILKQKRLSEVKSDFINNMTHELKTPLATIGLALDSIKHPATIGKTEEINKFTDIIAQENRRLTGHVEKILQLAKMDKGELVVSFEKINLNELIKQATNSFKLRLESRDAMLELNLDDGLPELKMDANHIFNSIANLIDNAIKYSPEKPSLTITTKRDKGYVNVLVQDKGIGMTADEQKKVLKTFYRAQKGDLHNVKGFGLGLSYTREVIRLHQGEMILKSQPGKGSAVGFKLPVP